MTDDRASAGLGSAIVLPRWLAVLGQALDHLATACLWLAMLVLALTLVLMNVEIATRYLLGSSTLIADEYGGYGFCITVMAGLLYAHRRNALLRVDFAVARLRGRARGVVLALGAALSAGLALVTAYAGYQAWSLSWLFASTSAFASETPLWIPQAAVPLGMGLLALSFVEEMLRRLCGTEG